MSICCCRRKLRASCPLFPHPGSAIDVCAPETAIRAVDIVLPEQSALIWKTKSEALYRRIELRPTAASGKDTTAGTEKVNGKENGLRTGARFRNDAQESAALRFGGGRQEELGYFKLFLDVASVVKRTID